MIVNYRGFELEAVRDETLGGWMNCYFTALMYWVLKNGGGDDDGEL